MALTAAQRQKNYRKRKKLKPHGETVVLRADTDAVLALLEKLPRIRVSLDGPYTFDDRARDFIAVFSTPEGQRVLSMIGQICDPPIHLPDADKHGVLAFKAGMRRVMAEIQACFVARAPLIQRSEDVGSRQQPANQQ